jgi:hypothetical protein
MFFQPFKMKSMSAAAEVEAPSEERHASTEPATPQSPESLESTPLTRGVIQTYWAPVTRNMNRSTTTSHLTEGRVVGYPFFYRWRPDSQVSSLVLWNHCNLELNSDHLLVKHPNGSLELLSLSDISLVQMKEGPPSLSQIYASGIRSIISFSKSATGAEGSVPANDVPPYKVVVQLHTGLALEFTGWEYQMVSELLENLHSALSIPVNPPLDSTIKPLIEFSPDIPAEQPLLNPPVEDMERPSLSAQAPSSP